MYDNVKTQIINRAWLTLKLYNFLCNEINEVTHTFAESHGLCIQFWKLNKG
jgi:hypothetical protein